MNHARGFLNNCGKNRSEFFNRANESWGNSHKQESEEKRWNLTGPRWPCKTTVTGTSISLIFADHQTERAKHSLN
jgi:hypothetical protein